MERHSMKVVLAYSGGLDTTVAIKWLQDKYDAEVITVTINVGQMEDMGTISERSKIAGAKKHYSVDATEEFVSRFVVPEIMANGLYEGKYPLVSSLSRPLIASKLVEVAKAEGADAVAHGCTGKGNDQVRIEITAKALAPHLKVIAPVREWNLSREQEINYALSSGIPVTPKKSKYSIDQNLWGRSIECGELEDPNAEPDETAFEWTTPPEKAPDRPEYVMLEFKGGVPTSLNGECKDLRYIIQELNGIAGRNGVGRIDHIEDRVVGIKSREVYECPAASVIIEAHKDLEKMTLTKHQVAFKSIVDEKWAELLYTGLWVDPLREDLERFIVSTQRHVNGSVRLKLYKGGMRVVGRSSPNSLYDMGLATYEERSTFDQRLSSAFIELWGLQSVTANKAHGHSEG